MMRKAVTTNKSSAGNGPYSQGIVANGFLFVSGQGPLDPETGAVIGETIEQQTRLTMDNVQNIVEAAGCSMDDVVQVTVYLARMSDFHAFNKMYEQFFNRPMPARTCVEAVLDDILIEIDAIAALPNQP